MFRRDQLCPEPWNCADVQMLDLEADRDSPPCLDCPREALDRYLRTDVGQWLVSIMDIDFAIHHGFTVTMDEISYRDFLVLKIVVAERARFEADLQKAEIEKQKRGR